MTVTLGKSQMVEFCTNAPASSQRLRILFLTPFAPNLQAGHGGSRVIAQLITHLAQRNVKIGLCYLRYEKEPTVDTLLRERCEVIEEVVISENGASGLKRGLERLQIWKAMLAGKPLWAIDRYSPDYEERLKDLLKTWHPDVVQIEFHVMGQYLPVLMNYPAPRILIEHEPGAEAARESLKSPYAQGRMIPFLDLFAWQQFERRITAQVDTVVVFTERDRKAIRGLGQKTPIVEIPLGTEISEAQPISAPREPLSLVFVGNFKHPPNLDAADRLINHIFPRVQAQFPEVQLFIVGDHLPASIQRHEDKNVIVTGYVPDVAPYLKRAALVVVPLRLGGGMRVKMLEALAAGTAIIASSRAVEGLDVVDGEQLILAEDDNEFAGAIIDLLHNSEKRLALAREARSWASANLSWDGLAAVYERLYRSLLRC